MSLSEFPPDSTIIQHSDLSSAVQGEQSRNTTTIAGKTTTSGHTSTFRALRGDTSSRADTDMAQALERLKLDDSVHSLNFPTTSHSIQCRGNLDSVPQTPHVANSAHAAAGNNAHGEHGQSASLHNRSSSKFAHVRTATKSVAPKPTLFSTVAKPMRHGRKSDSSSSRDFHQRVSQSAVPARDARRPRGRELTRQKSFEHDNTQSRTTNIVSDSTQTHTKNTSSFFGDRNAPNLFRHTRSRIERSRSRHRDKDRENKKSQSNAERIFSASGPVSSATETGRRRQGSATRTERHKSDFSVASRTDTNVPASRIATADSHRVQFQGTSRDGIKSTVRVPGRSEARRSIADDTSIFKIPEFPSMDTYHSIQSGASGENGGDNNHQTSSRGPDVQLSVADFIDSPVKAPITAPAAAASASSSPFVSPSQRPTTTKNLDDTLDRLLDSPESAVISFGACSDTERLRIRDPRSDCSDNFLREFEDEFARQ